MTFLLEMDVLMDYVFVNNSKVREKIKILVLGQTPPPFLGQAMMIERLVKAKFEHVEIIHVRMAFSDRLKAIGKFSFRKVFHLFTLIVQTLYYRFKYGASILYYPPSGPNRNPMLRDFVILFFVRPFFKKTIFHYRAAGVSQLLERSSPVIRFIGRKLYDRPDAAIQLSSQNPPDGKYFRAKRTFIIKNGLEDAAEPYLPIIREAKEKLRVLYLGALYETKGVYVILDAVRILKKSNFSFEFVCVGDFVSPVFQAEVLRRRAEYEIDEYISFPGERIGDEKWKEYLKADIFCFPSFVESESFGSVVVEAMMFEIPVIASRWQGVRDIVVEGETGFFIPIKDPVALAEKIQLLASDPEKRRIMGINARNRFLSDYRLSQHLDSMEKMFIQVAESN